VFGRWHPGCPGRAFVEYHWAELGVTILMLVLVAGALTVSDLHAFRRWNRKLRRLIGMRRAPRYPRPDSR
jgi:hypothetical protein